MRAGIIEQFATFELLAELGLGLAGFGGVAAAFGGRSKDYGSTDLVRIRALFFLAGSVVAGSLAILTLASYGLDDATSFLVTSAALALISGAAAVPLCLASYRIVRDAKSGAPAWLYFPGPIYFVVVETFYVLNVFKGGGSSPLIGAFSVSLIYGLWMFSRLVVRPNW